MIHVIKMNKINQHDYVKQLDFDPERFSLFCRSKFGGIAQIQLIYKRNVVRSLILEVIDSYKNAPNKDFLTHFKSMDRMGSYVEGTKLG